MIKNCAKRSEQTPYPKRKTSLISTKRTIHVSEEHKVEQPFWKEVKKYLTKLNIVLNISFHSCTRRYQFGNLCPKVNLHIDVYNSFIHNLHILEKRYTSIGTQITLLRP